MTWRLLPRPLNTDSFLFTLIFRRDPASVRSFCSQILSYFTPWSVEYYSSSKVFLSTMSFQAFSRVARAFSFGGSRQFLGRRLGERSSHIRQEKRPATQDEMGMLVLGLGLFTSASVWVRKKTIFRLNFGRIFYARIQRLKVKGKPTCIYSVNENFIQRSILPVKIDRTDRKAYKWKWSFLIKKGNVQYRKIEVIVRQLCDIVKTWFSACGVCCRYRDQIDENFVRRSTYLQPYHKHKHKQIIEILCNIFQLYMWRKNTYPSVFTRLNVCKSSDFILTV